MIKWFKRKIQVFIESISREVRNILIGDIEALRSEIVHVKGLSFENQKSIGSMIEGHKALITEKMVVQDFLKTISDQQTKNGTVNDKLLTEHGELFTQIDKLYEVMNKLVAELDSNKQEVARVISVSLDNKDDLSKVVSNQNSILEKIHRVIVDVDEMKKRNADADQVEALKGRVDHLCEVVSSNDIYQSIYDRLLNLEKMMELLENQVHPRTRTIEWNVRESYFMLKDVIDEIEYHNNSVITSLDKELNVQLLKHNDNLALHTNYPIAVESNDYLHPESTVEGRNKSIRFVTACERIYQDQEISLLDMGCGAGGLVFGFASRGHDAIGIDGSDHCKNIGVGYWNVLPENFLNCDITKEFQVFDETSGLPAKFDVITMWEVFEHIPEDHIHDVLLNVRKHMHSESYFVGTISLLEYYDEATGVVYHVTLKPKTWWAKVFAECGLEMVEDSPFGKYEYARGLGGNYQDRIDYYKNPEAGFHFVAKSIAQAGGEVDVVS